MSYRSYKWSWTAAAVAGALCLSGPALAMDRPDAWITTKAKIALLTTSGVSGTAIHVDTTDGRDTIYGSVARAPDRTKAEQAVRSIEGVREIRDLVQVVPAKATKIVESNITSPSAAKMRLLAHSETPGMEINVDTNDGIVTLECYATAWRSAVVTKTGLALPIHRSRGSGRGPSLCLRAPVAMIGRR